MKDLFSRILAFCVQLSVRWYSNVKRFFVVHQRGLGALSAAMLFICAALYVAYIEAPASFPAQETVTVAKGSSVSEIGESLHESHVIRSPMAFMLFVKLTLNEANIQAGDYYFNTPANLFSVLQRIASGAFGLTPLRITIPEGATAQDVADIMSKKFKSFDSDTFMTLVTENKAEGYLFPDTYTFLPNVKAKEAYETMRDNFEEQIATIREEIDASGKPLTDIVTMASLLEREARQYKTKQMIAGILWARIKIGMPLQVDAVFPYILGKNTITYDDLNVDSPYNTYKNLGLPPGPIANPGLASLRAAANPIDSPFLYYLTDADGGIHYSKTFQEHKRNIAKYLQ